MLDQKRRFCDYCDRYVLAAGEPFHASLHVLLTLLTCGLWMPVGLWLALNHKYRCQRCGKQL